VIVERAQAEFVAVPEYVCGEKIIIGSDHDARFDVSLVLNYEKRFRSPCGESFNYAETSLSNSSGGSKDADFGFCGSSTLFLRHQQVLCCR